MKKLELFAVNGYGSGVHPLYAVVKSASLFTVVKIATSSTLPVNFQLVQS